MGTVSTIDDPFLPSNEADCVTGGTYTLLVELPRTVALAVGALGERTVPAGWYAYTGSAFGPGGFARVDRHYELAAGDRETRHWHVDYLLCHPDSRLRGDVRHIDVDVECAVATALPDGPVADFGSSDCDCRSHLSFATDEDRLRNVVDAAYRTVLER